MLLGRRNMGFGVLKDISSVVFFLLTHLGKFSFCIFIMCISIFFLAGSLKALIRRLCKVHVLHAGLIQCLACSWCSISSSYNMHT